jgi:hypothetical protein
MSRAVLFLVVATALLTGCSIDRVEWESSGFPVEEATHALEEEHHAVDPAVECIQREAQGGVWECRAHAGDEEFECMIHVGPRKKIRSLHCEPEHEEGAPAGEHGEEPEEPADEESAEH